MPQKDKCGVLPEAVEYSNWQPVSNVDPDGYKIVSVRLREPEYEAFSNEVASLGLTNNFVLRAAARRISGFLEVDAETRRVLRETMRGIGDLAGSISQLSSEYRKSGKVDMEALADHRKAFGEQFVRLDAQLGRILNVSYRRSDGRIRLAQILEKESAEFSGTAGSAT